MDRSLLGIVVTFILSPLLPLMHVAIIRLRRNSSNHVAYMFVSFALYSLTVITYSYTANNGFTEATATSMACIIIVCLLYAEFFSMICRGFSLQIILDIFTKGSMELNDLVHGYAGRGIQWLLTKRIASLSSIGLILTTEKHIALPNKTAIFIGNLGLLFKKLFNLPQGG